MAKTLIVQLTCDRCKAEKSDTVEGTETVSFAFDGYTYSLDLCKEHGEDFHNTIQGLMSAASDRTRLAGQRPRRAASGADSLPATESRTARRSPDDRDRLKATREWARKNGFPELGDRGRIPQAIAEAFEAAH